VTLTDRQFLDQVTDQLGSLPGVEAVALGGSRAQGTQRADSDWDFGIYYRRTFDPQSVRDLGWPGEVSELGGWGGGVFNGGAWLQVDRRAVDIHYRDLERIEHEVSEAAAGRVHIEPLMFHLAGVPTYLVLAELAVNTVLVGDLPRPAFPPSLQAAARQAWWARAAMTLSYARTNHAPLGRVAQCLGLLVQGSSQAAHAVLAARAEWVTNEKNLLTRAGLRDIDAILGETTSDPERLISIADRISRLCAAAVASAPDRAHR